MRIELLVVGAIETPCLNAKFRQQSFCNCTVRGRTLNRLRAAIAQQQPLSYAKFVALGVAAEIVMVVENKDASFRGRGLAEKVRCR